MFLGLKTQEYGLPPAYLRVVVCERMGWTLAEFDDLSVGEIGEILAVWDGIEKARPRK